MNEYDVNDFDDIQNEDLPNSGVETTSQTDGFGIDTSTDPEPGTTPQAGGGEINTPPVNDDIPVPELDPLPTGEEYNPNSTTEDADDGSELGSCDCRSECKYHTGKTWKYSDYGYSD